MASNTVLTKEQRERAASELAREDSGENPIKWPYEEQRREYLGWSDYDLLQHYRATFDQDP